MFESALFQVLVNDADLVSKVSLFKGAPSIFEGTAPENVDFPYVTFSIHGGGGPDSAVDTFTITVTYFGWANSGKAARLAVRRIIELLDRQHLSHEYFDTIRVFRGGFDEVENEDPRAQQYYARFTARAGRSGWMRTI